MVRISCDDYYRDRVHLRLDAPIILRFFRNFPKVQKTVLKGHRQTCLIRVQFVAGIPYCIEAETFRLFCRSNASTATVENAECTDTGQLLSPANLVLEPLCTQNSLFGPEFFLCKLTVLEGHRQTCHLCMLLSVQEEES